MAGMPGPPLEERAQLAIACSSGRIVCNRLTTAPGPDPVPPAAHLRASTVQAGHPVVASTAACGRRLGGGPARDGLRHLPRPRSSTDRGHGVTPHSLRPNYSAQTSRVPRNVAVRARALRQRSRALSGTFFVIKSGSDLAIGPTPAPSEPMLLLREVAGRLQAQVKQTTRAINRLHNLLARVFPELATLTEKISVGWVLKLLEKYPTAERIAAAHRSSLEKIPYLPAEQAVALHQAAQQSVASLRGDVAEALVRDLVDKLRHSQRAEKKLRQMLIAAFANLPASPHVQVLTIPGIGDATVAVLVAKIVDIGRFATPDHLVSYFGVFPEESSSGVDKRGKPLPPGTLVMSPKGNDLVRAYHWNAARSAIQRNPAIRALYRRLRAKGKRGDVAFGHCMRKLLHLVHAVWKTDRPFDREHFPWSGSSDTQPSTTTPPSADAGATPSANEKAVGHKRDLPAEEVVTTA